MIKWTASLDVGVAVARHCAAQASSDPGANRVSAVVCRVPGNVTRVPPECPFVGDDARSLAAAVTRMSLRCSAAVAAVGVDGGMHIPVGVDGAVGLEVRAPPRVSPASRA